MADHDEKKYGLYIPKEAWHTEITIMAKVLYGLLDPLPTFDVGGCFASREWMAKKIGCSKQRITELIRILIDEGLICFNGYHLNANGKRTRLLKRIPLAITNKKLLNLANEKSLVGSLANDKSLELANEKSLPNIISNNIKESTPTFSKPKIPADWKSPDYNKKIKYLLETNPKLNRLHLRFVLNHQEAQIENLPMSFQSFTDKQLINQIVNGTKVITRLKKTGLSFSNLIKPVIEWGRDESDFWPSKLISLVEISKISKTNGQMKIMNVHSDWVKAKKIDPKVGRYLDRNDFKITDGFEKWDAKTPEEKRKAQDEFVPRRRPPLPPDFKHPENFKPEEIPQFMKDIFNNNQRN